MITTSTGSRFLVFWTIKAKFHYAIWFEAGSKLVADLSATSFEPASNQLRTSFEPDSVMEFGLYIAKYVYRSDL